MTNGGVFTASVAVNPDGSYKLQQTRIAWDAWVAASLHFKRRALQGGKEGTA